MKILQLKLIFSFRDEYGTVYKSGTLAGLVYEVSGSSLDWAHDKLGIKYSYALELRDRGEFGFMLPVNQIEPTVKETFAGVAAMANEIYKKDFVPN